MFEVSTDNNLPDVFLHLEIPSLLNRFYDPADRLYNESCVDIANSIAGVMEVLGIPGLPKVTITSLSDESESSLRITVNGRLCRYPDLLLQFAYSYVIGQHPDPDLTPSQIFTRLGEAAFGEVEPGRESVRLVEFLSLACMEAVKRQPSLLLGEQQVIAYIAMLNDLSTDSDLKSKPVINSLTSFSTILNKILNLKISIANIHTVVKVLKQANDESLEEIVEKLIGALCSDIIEVQFHPKYLRRLTCEHKKNGPEMFTRLREGLFEELGVIYPEFQFVLNKNLKPNCFALKINDLVTLPLIGLSPDQCLVNDTVPRLGLMSLVASATINPASGLPGAVIDMQNKNAAINAGLTTWDQFEYFILCMASVLRNESASLINRKSVQTQLDQFKVQSPSLIQAIRTYISDERITSILRLLVAEGISIRHLRIILDRLLNLIFSKKEKNLHILPEVDHANIVSFVRTGLKRQIGFKLSRGTSTVVTYLLDSKVESLILENVLDQSRENITAVFDDAIIDKILNAIKKEIKHLPPTAWTPCILTTQRIRPYLRQIVVAEFPHISICTYSELTQDINIQPVARISFDT